ncbi:hypothetical protein KRX19_03965 [Cardiobacteriaceae bacterium TAE3-ERU3]|nr:hypothetical protein [Cardiobacteriaceae bacterium TAE3-ERU3]
MKAAAYFTALLSALVLLGCATPASTFQEISDARSAVTQAAMQMANCRCEDSAAASPCACDVLKEAQSEISRAEALLHDGDQVAASQAAHKALLYSQNLLRELHHGAKN